ncbi:MAG: MFS transporter [Solirubrobacteraceae bacterium]|jgi:MFS family permease
MRELLRIPVFRRLLAAFALNELAWSVGTLALAVLVYRRTGSALGSTGFFLCSQVVPAVLSPPLVARLDRMPPARVLPAMYALEAVLFGVLGWMTSRFALVPVLALALADGVVASAARSLAWTARAQVLKPLDLLHEGNAVTYGAFSVCYMGGPLIGGAVVAAGGTIAALLANSAFFAVMAVVLATGALPRAVPEGGPSSGRLRAALAHVRSNDWIERLLMLQCIGLVFFAISTPVEVVFAQHTLHAGAGGYGVLMSCWGAGAVVGSAAYARWSRRSAAALIAVSAGCLGLGFAVMAVAPTLWVAVIGAALGGSGNAIELVAARTVIQERTPEEWMAILMSLVDVIIQLAPGLGILLGGVITTLTNPRLAFAIAAAGSFCFAGTVFAVLRPSQTSAPGAGGDQDSSGMSSRSQGSGSLV